MQDRHYGDASQHHEQTSKSFLLMLVTALVVGLIGPLVIPHIAHPDMIIHILIHLASLTVASFLSIVSLLAYQRAGGARILLMTIGFMVLTASELLHFLDNTGIIASLHIPAINTELPHVIMLIMLGLFGIGVLKPNNSNAKIR